MFRYHPPAQVVQVVQAGPHGCTLPQASRAWPLYHFGYHTYAIHTPYVKRIHNASTTHPQSIMAHIRAHLPSPAEPEALRPPCCAQLCPFRIGVLTRCVVLRVQLWCWLQSRCHAAPQTAGTAWLAPLPIGYGDACLVDRNT